MDELANFAAAPWPAWPRPRPRLLDRADVVFTGGRFLHEAKTRPQPERLLLPVGRRAPSTSARALDPEPLPLPDDIAGLPRPIFGYYGVVDERLDYDLIARLADASGVGSVVLVGPTIKVDPARCPRRAEPATTSASGSYARPCRRI